MRKLSMILIVVVVAALVYAWVFRRDDIRALKDKLKGAPAMTAAGPALPEVGVAVLKPEEIIITQELNGRVTPFLIAEVRPQVNGIVLSRQFDEGSDVEKDMQLYQIDPSMYEAELNRAMAALAKAKANVAVAAAKLARYKRLIEAKAVNQQEYDEVEAASKQAEADVGIAEADVRVARINVEYAKVLSPIDGRIGKSSVTQGALVTASQAAPLAVVQQLDPIYVDVTQPISWMMNLRSDMQAGILQNTGESYAEMRVMLGNGEVYELPGKLLFADVTVDQTTGSISLRAEFPNPKHVLLPGMYVRALLDVAQKEGAITVPQRALIRNPDGSAYVLVVREDGTVARQNVTTIRTIDDKWLIGEGLKGNEQVVIDGIQRIRFVPGQPAPKVKPVIVDLKSGTDSAVRNGSRRGNGTI